MKNNNTYMKEGIPFPIKEKELKLSFIEDNFDKMVEKISSRKQNGDPIYFENEWNQEYKLIFQSYALENY